MIKKEYSLINWIEFKCLKFCNSELLCFCCPNRPWNLPTAQLEVKTQNGWWRKFIKDRSFKSLTTFEFCIIMALTFIKILSTPEVLLFRRNSVKIHVCIYKMWKLWIQIRFRPKMGSKIHKSTLPWGRIYSLSSFLDFCLAGGVSIMFRNKVRLTDQIYIILFSMDPNHS